MKKNLKLISPFFGVVFTRSCKLFSALLILSLLFFQQVYAVDTAAGKAALSEQQKSVRGTVTDANGNTLPGVNVLEKGTTNGIVTNIDGEYSINLKADNSILVFSFIGYNSKEIEVGNKATINVELFENIQELESVVILGYGSMDRNNVTGAISSIQTKELSKAPVPNLVEAMRGQVPGVRMTRTSGQPGSGVNFLIRGKNSLNSSNEPLIVIDGVPSTGGNLAELNTQDIESINVLKDAAAASIYGSRGANGVILITTKSGKAGKTVMNINYSQGFSDLVQKPDLMKAEQFVQLKRDANEGAGRDNALEVALRDAVEYDNYTNTDGIQEIDWHDVLLRIGKVTNAGVSLSGGNDKMSFYMNGDAYLEDGIVEYSSYDRYSFRLNADYKPFKFMKVGARVQLSKTIADETGSSAVMYQGKADFTDFLSNTPLGRLYDENNELVPTVKGDQFDYNPLYKYRESNTERSTNRTFVNPFVEFNILDGLTLTINGSAELRNENYGRFTSSMYNASTLQDEPGRNTMTKSTLSTETFLLDNILSYNKNIGGKHHVNATMVYGFQTFNNESLKVIGEGSPTDLLSYYSLGSGLTEFYKINLETDEWASMYYVARLGYSFDGRYVFTGTARYDGSSIFGPEYRWGLFPSLSFAWNVTEEAFLKNNDVVNSLKYRLSWGRMGNDQIGSYGFIARTKGTSYPFSGTVNVGLTSDNLPNEYLHWETSQQLNTGIDFSLLKNRMFGSIDAYRTQTFGLILDQLIPSATGYPSIVSNIGETMNQGVEVNVGYRVLDGDFKWDVNLNWAFDRNKIIRLNDAEDEAGNVLNDEANGWFIGQDIDVIYDWDYIGVYQTGEEDIAAAMEPTEAGYGPGDPKIRDVSKDGVITFEDKTFLGSPTPNWYGGLKNTFTYKGLELTVLIESVQGVTRVNNFYGNLQSRSNEINVDYWTPDNPSNLFPQPNVKKPYPYANAVRVRDASFIALRNVSLSYSLPKSMIEAIKVSNVQLYVRGNNLKYFTDYKDAYSPETEVGAFPITKNWTLGANITF